MTMAKYEYDYDAVKRMISLTCFTLAESGKEVTIDEYTTYLMNHPKYGKVTHYKLNKYCLNYFLDRVLYPELEN